MDGLEFTEKVIGHIVVLLTAYAWPIVGVLVVLLQKEAIGKLIEGIKELSLKIGNNEAKIGTGKIEALGKTVEVAEEIAAEQPGLPAENAPHEPPQRRVPDAEPEPEHVEAGHMEEPALLVEPADGAKIPLRAKQRFKFRDSVVGSTPSVVIERAWQEVRSSVYKLLGIDKTAETWWDLEGLPDDQLIAKLKADPRVGGTLMRAVAELKMVRNDAVSAIGWKPTTDEGLAYLQNARRVVELVEQAAQKKPQ